MPDTIVIGQPVGTGGVALTTNFDQTVTALVASQIETNLRKVTRYMGAGGYRTAQIQKGTNKLRYIAYGDLPVPAVLPPNPNVQPWLKEGVRPDLEALTIAYEEFTAYQAGRLVGISDVALQFNPHDLFAVAAERIAFNALQTVDQYVAAVLHAGTNVQFVTGAAGTINITAAMKMTIAEIREAVTKLKIANVPTFPDGYYHAFIHPNLIYDLEGESGAGGWLEAVKYASPEAIMTGEIGRLYGVRFIETPVGTALGGVGASGAQVYSTFVFGPDAWAFGDVQAVRTYMVRPGGDHTDPLAQLAEVGWKGMFGAKLLTAVGARYIRIETGATVL